VKDNVLLVRTLPDPLIKRMLYNRKPIHSHAHIHSSSERSRTARFKNLKVSPAGERIIMLKDKVTVHQDLILIVYMLYC
jgi:hypothetical protein